jgi:hypothetical protein
MPTKHRRDAEKLKMAGWTWFPFDVIDWLTSEDVLRMSAAERGIYITLLCVQWRDGYVHVSDVLAAKVSGLDRRSVAKWMQTWNHLFPIVQPTGSQYAASAEPTCSKRVNPKLQEIALNVQNPKARQGIEERREEESRETSSLREEYSPAPPSGVAFGAPLEDKVNPLEGTIFGKPIHPWICPFHREELIDATKKHDHTVQQILAGVFAAIKVCPKCQSEKLAQGATA